MQAMSQPCNIHGLCGPNGICHYSPQPTCSCPPGYVMSNPGNWTEGCAAIVNITCDHHDHESMKFVKLPHTDFWGSDQQHLLSVSFQTCRNICIHDCTQHLKYEQYISSFQQGSVFQVSLSLVPMFLIHIGKTDTRREGSAAACDAGGGLMCRTKQLDGVAARNAPVSLVPC
uniref:KPRO n=1 Tax=Arundo donax TaxID=35708 RepID=A0A0A9GQA1_ARUDO